MKDQQVVPERLIIIGAGMAGIKLAHYCLERKSDMQITILEANNYIGGRIRHCQFEGHTVEMGANWISGMDTIQNPVWGLAKDVQLTGHFVDRSDDRATQVVLDNHGNDVQKDYFETMDRFDWIYEKAVQACAHRGIKAHNDVGVRSLLQEFGWPKEDQLTAIERSVEYNMLQVWGANSLSEFSAAYNMEEGANDVDLGKDEFFVEDARGFNCIMNGMAEDIRKKGAVIKLQSQVQRVNYTPGNVRVTAKCQGALEEYPADAVVSTISLGVLQSNKIEFLPPFPEWKTRALNQVEMFVFSKVYAQFDHEFWSSIKHQFIVVSEKRDRYPLWMRYRNASDKNLFMCYIGGPEAKRVESLSTEQIKAEIEEHFRNAFCSKIDKHEDPSAVFRPSAVAVTDWSKNPRFCGSYSLFPAHAFSNMPIEDLTRGLTTGTQEGGSNGSLTLYFAGEGFDDKYNGWVQGAFRSGERVAKLILGVGGTS